MSGKWNSVLVIGALLAVAAPATSGFTAQLKNFGAGQNVMKHLLIEMDTNKDGVVSKEEFMAYWERTFARLNKNKSGELDPKELKHLKIWGGGSEAEQVKQLLLLMDTDRNGRVSKQEFMHFMQLEFARLDDEKEGEVEITYLGHLQFEPD